MNYYNFMVLWFKNFDFIVRKDFIAIWWICYSLLQRLVFVFVCKLNESKNLTNISKYDKQKSVKKTETLVKNYYRSEFGN